ncbi:unnamed protein product [Closterium sp. NIES-53]
MVRKHVPFSADGIRVLGSPIGPQSGCAAMVQERLSAAAEPLPLLSQMDPQLCLLLLTRCVSRRASYLVRTTPLDVLPEDTWSAWGEQLLHTYLSAAHTAIPREEEERGRIWRQAALPVTLGGLGITNPATEGAFAYLASVISSAHLLHSFGDTVHPAIARMLPLMVADADSPSTLPRRLAAAEDALPPNGLEALQVGRRTPDGPKLQQAFACSLSSAGDWLLAIPLIPALRLGPSQHSTAASFRLGLPLPVPRHCDCRYRTTFPDHRLPNHLMRFEKGGGRIATHHALRDECAKIAAEAGYTVHTESTVYSPVENLKADVCIRHPDTGEVHMCDITVTDPVSHQDELARKAPGWAARMQAARKEDKYARRNAWVGFHAMAVETYGYPSPGVHAFLRNCAELAGKRRFNAAPKSGEVARLLTEYRQRWSVTLQRAQANALRDKTHEAIAADELGLQDPFGSLGEEQLYQLLEDPTGQENLKADISIRHPDTGAVWICDITVTDPVSHQDEYARKAPGWAARMQADKKETKYAGRSPWVGFYAMTVETYGYPSPGVLDFLRSCAELAAKRRFNATPKSREVAKLLTEYRQRWSMTLQRAQANALRDKTHGALTADALGLQGPFTPLSEGQLYQLIEDPSGH